MQTVTVMDPALADRIRAETGENVYLCYQCVKCTSGCPLVEYFDLAPNQILRAAQLGKQDLIYESRTPWLCAGCQTCTTRCPQGIDVARVMDFIVMEAIAQGKKAQVPEVAIFNKVFLRNANLLGRVYELGLAAEMNARTLRPFNDLGFGLAMIKRGKLNLLPQIVRRRKHRDRPAAEARPENEVGYYPGCSLHAGAKEYDRSTRSVLATLGLTPIEPHGWTCCGSTPAHRSDHRSAVRMPMENMLLLEQQGLREVVLPCASCFNRFRAADQELQTHPELKADLSRELGTSLRGDLQFSSLLDLLVNRLGYEPIESQVKRPLQGLRIACYYGCLLTRPPDVTGAQRPEYPMEMDRIVKALGATPVDWDYKVACCGGSLSLTRKDIVLDISAKIIANARARGADILALACPLCQVNLDGRQTQMELENPFPTLYLTQLMAIAFGQEDDADLQRNMIDPRPLLAERGLLGPDS